LDKVKFVFLLAWIIILFSLSWLIVSRIPEDNLYRQINEIVAPYRFDLGKWEVVAIGNELGSLFTEEESVSAADKSVVTDYFDNLERIRWLELVIKAIREGTMEGDSADYEEELTELNRYNSEIIDKVEAVLKAQIIEALNEHGIYSPWGVYSRNDVNFPPLEFILSKPPRLLVISPRDRIERIRDITLVPEMDITDMEDIETRISELDYSGLVIGVGGMATYPSYVTDNAGLKFVISTIIEEWLHQYLAFKPLGFLYILDLTGICNDDDIATMNETLVGIVSDEIATIVYDKYYSFGEPEPSLPVPTEPVFDFNKEMREIRRTADNMLARGEVEAAESFMEEKRQYILENGYYVRKLNQAYFAFYGTYADSPTSINPIGEELKQLRQDSTSLKEFLDTVAEMTTREELAESVN
jgi:hypothetical protein